MDQASVDPRAALDLINAWRAHESRLVAEFERTPIELVAERLAPLSDLSLQRSPAAVLLAVLSEVHEETQEDTRIVLAGLDGDTSEGARAFRSAWEALDSNASPTQSGRRRILVVGGDPSERPRVASLEQRHSVSIDWIPADSGGVGPATQRIREMDAERDAVIIVTGRIGHPLMHNARRFAEAQGVPCRFVYGLTARRLDEVLRTLDTGDDAAHEEPTDCTPAPERETGPRTPGAVRHPLAQPFTSRRNPIASSGDRAPSSWS